MSEIAALAGAIFKCGAGAQRVIVAIAGPPGSGKSTLAQELRSLLPEGSAAVVPMDGFHYDDAVLLRRGMRQRKGAPETFDFAGFETMLKRLKAIEPETAIPVFDRSMELSRGSAEIVAADVKFVLVEGNYLLLDEEPWSQLAAAFDLTVFVDVARSELERRLVERWRGHGKTDEEGRAWIASNDMPNIDRVLAAVRPPDIRLPSQGTAARATR